MTKSRSQTITQSGYLFIAINFFLAVFNIIVGLLSNSIAIASDAIHSLTDSISGFLIIVSEKTRQPQKILRLPPQNRTNYYYYHRYNHHSSWRRNHYRVNQKYPLTRGCRLLRANHYCASGVHCDQIFASK